MKINREENNGKLYVDLTNEFFNTNIKGCNGNTCWIFTNTKNYYFTDTIKMYKTNGDIVVKSNNCYELDGEIDPSLLDKLGKLEKSTMSLLKITEEKCSFLLTDEIMRKFSFLDGVELTKQDFSLKFSVQDLTLEVTLRASSNVISKMKLSLVIFNYIYYVTGMFIHNKGFSTYYTSEFGTIKHYFVPKTNDYECANFSRLNIQLDIETFQETFPKFLKLYTDNIYPLEVYMQTQTKIKFNIQQRVSLILNSMEGVLKRTLEKEQKRISVSKKQKTKILSAVKDVVIEYLESKAFLELIEELEFDEKIDIVSRVSNTMGRFTELTFDEVLEISKTINPIGYDFVKGVNMPVKFWKRCKDHRNFYAHLTEDTHKGFNGVQSLYAIFTLSNYFRLLVLQLSDFNVNEQEIVPEIESINSWIYNLKISDEISAID